MSFITTWIVVAIIFIQAARWKKCACIWDTLLQRLPSRVPSSRNDPLRPATPHLKAIQKAKVRTNSTDPEELDLYKGLYFKLHNLEQHPTVLTQARDVLISLFAEKLSEVNGSGKGRTMSCLCAGRATWKDANLADRERCSKTWIMRNGGSSKSVLRKWWTGLGWVTYTRSPRRSVFDPSRRKPGKSCRKSLETAISPKIMSFSGVI
jgi:hypothetical protein